MHDFLISCSLLIVDPSNTAPERRQRMKAIRRSAFALLPDEAKSLSDNRLISLVNRFGDILVDLCCCISLSFGRPRMIATR